MPEMSAKSKRDSMEDEEKAEAFILQDSHLPQDSVRLKDEMTSQEVINKDAITPSICVLERRD